MGERDAVDLILDQWALERPDLDSSPMGVVGRLSRLSRMIEHQLEVVYAGYGLDGGLYDVLATLRRSGEPFRLRSAEFSRALMLTASGATKRLDRLERSGMIRREPDPDDRRGVRIVLTQKGRRLVDEVTPNHLEQEFELLVGLTLAEQRRLAGLLRKLGLGIDASQWSRGNSDVPK